MPPTPDPVRVSTPPIPIHRRPITAREVVQGIAVALTVALMIASRFPAALALISQAATAFGVTNVTPTIVASTGLAFIFGCFVPGSPLGRVLDWVASFFGGPQVSFTLADAQAAKDAVMPSAPRPERIPPSRDGGFASVRVLAWIVMAALFGLAGCSLLAGCGASPLQIGAVGVTVSLRAVAAVDQAYLGDLQHRVDACPADDSHDACVHAARDHTIEDGLDGFDLAVRGVGAGIAIAADVDPSAPLPDVVVSGVRRLLPIVDSIEAGLVARGIAVPPEIAMMLHALEAMIGGAS